MSDDWRVEALKLRIAGRHAESAALVRPLALAGNHTAAVVLARMGEPGGVSREEADRLLAAAEAHAWETREAQLHLELSRAYDQRLGAVPYEEKAARSLMHLEAAAELGAGAVHCLAVAVIYAQGTIGVPADNTRALHWCRKAAQQGSEEAVAMLPRLEQSAR